MKVSQIHDFVYDIGFVKKNQTSVCAKAEKLFVCKVNHDFASRTPKTIVAIACWPHYLELIL